MSDNRLFDNIIRRPFSHCVKFREPLILHLIKLNNLVYYKKVQIMLKVKSNKVFISAGEQMQDFFFHFRKTLKMRIK